MLFLQGIRPAAGDLKNEWRHDQMERFLGESTPKLGFGLMRLPRGEDGK